jgi:hypothetical protein
VDAPDFEEASLRTCELIAATPSNREGPEGEKVVLIWRREGDVAQTGARKKERLAERLRLRNKHIDGRGDA